jgi:N-acetylneuraminic acid mutarotase
MSGSSTVNANGGPSGVYGTLGVASTTNVPGGREGAVSWKDSGGNLWLFGGYGFDSTGTNANLNDLWEFSPTAKTWTWVSGGNTVPTQGQGQPGNYGTKGVAAASNIPGGRYSAVSWTDSSGNLWLFGGQGYDSTGEQSAFLNDLWEFSPATKEWTWMSGSNTPGAIVYGVYGTQGVGSASNVPGARSDAVSWTDSSGNFWLFGGEGPGSNPMVSAVGWFNDLWEFNPTTKMWTWMSGSNTENAVSVYGTQGTASASNVPGTREDAVSWIDSSGNLWLFGGQAFNSTGENTHRLNELWEFNPATKMWTWVSGSNTSWGPQGVYGTQGVSAAANVPGGRFDAVSWTDSSGNLWLFGGEGFDSTSALGLLNDLWEFSPTTKEWTWMSGSNTVPSGGAGQPGVYGTLGVPAAANVPGGRESAVSWIDSGGDLWLFGGGGSALAQGDLNDLWRYQP